MYGGPFYSMPFTYPPASTTAQMPTDQAAGVAPSVVETKPSDADGEPNHDDDDSDPVFSSFLWPLLLCEERPAVLVLRRSYWRCPPRMLLTISTVAPHGVRYLANVCLQASNGEGIAGQESDKLGDGAVQQSQGQPEGLQYLLPPDASGNQAAALAALLRANQGGENAELWRQQAAQLAGSGVDLSQLAAQAAGPGVHPLQVHCCCNVMHVGSPNTSQAAKARAYDRCKSRHVLISPMLCIARISSGCIVPCHIHSAALEAECMSQRLHTYTFCVLPKG